MTFLAMDPFSHASLGRTLVAFAPDEDRSRALLAAGTLGALAPDIDAVLMPFGWDLYLRAHEIGTHTIFGTLACALLTGGVVRLFARTQAWRTSVGAAWIGAVSHLALDLLSSARLRVLWPVADQQVSLPLVAMADPWLAAVLVLGAGTLVFARRNRRRIAGIVLAVGAGFLMLKAAMATRALGAYRVVSATNPASARVVEARWAALSEWHVFDRAAGHLRSWRISGTSRSAQLLLSWAIETESSLVSASRTVPTVRNFLRVHDLAFATTVKQPGGRDWILWSDIRYCWNPDAEDAPRLEPIVGVAGTRLACALWFGGELDGNGRIVRQIVKVVGLTQMRAVRE